MEDDDDDAGIRFNKTFSLLRNEGTNSIFSAVEKWSENQEHCQVLIILCRVWEQDIDSVWIGFYFDLTYTRMKRSISGVNCFAFTDQLVHRLFVSHRPRISLVPLRVFDVESGWSPSRFKNFVLGAFSVLAFRNHVLDALGILKSTLYVHGRVPCMSSLSGV